MKKSDLQADTIYRLKNGYEELKICVLKTNRNVAPRNRKMQLSCNSVGMQSPGIFTDAILALRAGYELIDVEDNHIINRNEAKDYVVITDGNTRFHAYELAMKQKSPFEYTFQYKQYANAEAFKEAYLQMNVCNTPTSTADMSRDIAARIKDKVVVSYEAKISDGLCPKAAGYATIGRQIGKKDMVDLNNGITPSLFNEQPILARFVEIYDGIKSKREKCPQAFKGAEIWSWNANMVNGADDKDSMVKNLVNMFANLSDEVFEQIKSAKKTGSETKEVVVKKILDATFHKFIAHE